MLGLVFAALSIIHHPITLSPLHLPPQPYNPPPNPAPNPNLKPILHRLPQLLRRRRFIQRGNGAVVHPSGLPTCVLDLRRRIVFRLKGRMLEELRAGAGRKTVVLGFEGRRHELSLLDVGFVVVVEGILVLVGLRLPSWRGRASWRGECRWKDGWSGRWRAPRHSV